MLLVICIFEQTQGLDDRYCSVIDSEQSHQIRRYVKLVGEVVQPVTNLCKWRGDQYASQRLTAPASNHRIYRLRTFVIKTSWPGLKIHLHSAELVTSNAPNPGLRRAQDILILCLFYREDHRSLKRSYVSTSQPDMDILWTLSICEAVALPAICAVLKSIAKQEEQSLPRWGQLLRGVFLSQIAAFAVVGLLSIHERALLLLCVAIGSWMVASLVLRHPRFDRHGFPHPETSDQVDLDVEQEHQSQSSGAIDWVSNFPWTHG